MLRFSCIIVLILVSPFVHAQNAFHLIHYGEFEGLQSELVKGVAKDKWGFLWLATDEGLVCYNGHEFVRYRDELPSPYIKSILKTTSGDLYATTDLGLVKIFSTPEGATFDTLLKGQTTQSDSLLWFPKLLYEDKQGNVWFADNIAVFKCTNDRVKRYNLPPKNQSFNWQRSASFAEDSLGNLFVISEPGYLYLYSPVDDALTEIELENSLGKVEFILNIGGDEFLIAADNVVLHAQIEKKKLTLFPTNFKIDAAHLMKNGDSETIISSWTNGLFRINRVNGELRVSKINEYSPKVANYALFDNGKLWVTSDNGIYLMSPMFFSSDFQTYSSSYVQDLEFFQGKAFYSDGNTVFSVSKNMEVKTVTKLANETLIQLLPDEKGIWYTTVSGKLCLFEYGKGSRVVMDLSNYGKAIFTLTKWKNQFWMCQDGNPSLVAIDSTLRITTYGSENGITGRPITLKTTSNGELFVGCNGDDDYFFKYNDQTNSFENLSQKIEEEHSDAIILTDIAFDEKRNQTWLGTSIGLYLIVNEKLRLIDLGDMKREAVKAIALAQDGALWIANSRGLVRYFDNEYLVFDEQEGLPSKIIAYRVLKTDIENNIWVGTVAGLGMSNAFDLPQKTEKPIIIKLRNNDVRVNPQKQTNFLSTSFLNIQFVAPTFPTQTLHYQWRLLGLSDSWKPVNKFDELFISQLNVGEYELQVKAKQGGNYTWSEPLIYKFSIRLPWNRLWWVWLLLFLTLLMLLWAAIRFYTFRLQLEKNQLEKEVNRRTAEIVHSNQALEVSKLELEQSKFVLEEALLELETANSHLQSQTRALNTTAIVSMTDAQGYIVLANDNFCKLSGYSRKELLGEKHSLLKSGIHTPEFYANMWRTIQKTKWRGEICNRSKQGVLYWVDATIVPFIGENGKPNKYLAIRIDITERKKIEASLRDKNEEILSSIQYASFIQGALLPPTFLLSDVLSDHFVFHVPRDVVSGDFYWVRKVKNKTLVAVVDCTGHGVPGAMMSMLGIAFLNEVSIRSNILSAGKILDSLRDLVKLSLRQVSLNDTQSDGMDLGLCVFDHQTNIVEFSGAHSPLYVVNNNELTEYLPTPNPIGVYRKEESFKTAEIKATADMNFYLFSDGYVDQFGGERNQKFMTRKFKALFSNIATKPMSEQGKEVKKTFEEWKGSYNQVDDVLVMGFRFPAEP